MENTGRINGHNKVAQSHSTLVATPQKNARSGPDSLGDSSLSSQNATKEVGCFQSFLNAIIGFFRMIFCCGSAQEETSSEEETSNKTPVDSPKDQLNRSGSATPPSAVLTEEQAASTPPKSRKINPQTLVAPGSKSASLMTSQAANSEQAASTPPKSRKINPQTLVVPGSKSASLMTSNEAKPDDLLAAVTAYANKNDGSVPTRDTLRDSTDEPEDAPQEKQKKYDPKDFYANAGVTRKDLPPAPGLAPIATPSSSRRLGKSASSASASSSNMFDEIKSGVSLRDSKAAAAQVETKDDSDDEWDAIVAKSNANRPKEEEDDWATEAVPTPLQSRHGDQPGQQTLKNKFAARAKEQMSKIASSSTASSVQPTPSSSLKKSDVAHLSAAVQDDEDREVLDNIAANAKTPTSKPSARQTFSMEVDGEELRSDKFKKGLEAAERARQEANIARAEEEEAKKAELAAKKLQQDYEEDVASTPANSVKIASTAGKFPMSAALSSKLTSRSTSKASSRAGSKGNSKKDVPSRSNSMAIQNDGKAASFTSLPKVQDDE